MSIDRETFDRSSESDLEDLSTADHVLAFLATNDDRAFKAKEIAHRIDREGGAVSTPSPD